MTLGRYALHGEIASGGMATVYFGRLVGPVGFSRVVAVKRMHPQIARDPEFVDMFLDEAQLAARIHHPNVVATLDVVAEGGEIFIVMEYVRGDSLAALLRAARKRGEPVPIPVASAIMIGVLAGLHAAHEARGERGEPLGIVHRDVSPHNILVGQDGLARLVDFGVAKAASRLQVTRGEQLKGKVSYMAPEQLAAGPKSIDRAADVFAAGAVLWELCASRRLFQGDDAGATIAQVLAAEVPSLARLRPDLSPALEGVIRRALQRDRADRFPTAEAFSDAIEAASPKLASARAVGEWVRQLAADGLAQREARVAELESVSKPATSLSAASGPAGAWAPGQPAGPSSVAPSSWPSAPGTWMPGGAPPGYHPSLTPSSSASGSAPQSASQRRPPVSPSDASVASVAVAPRGGGSQKGVLAVAIGGAAGLALLAVGIGVLSLRGAPPAATGAATPAATAAASADPVVEASGAVSAAAPAEPAPEAADPEPEASAAAPSASSAAAPAATASSAPAKKTPAAASAARPRSTSYLPDAP